MLTPVRHALEFLRGGERRRYVGVLLLSAVAAVVQTLAIVSIMPFIWLLTEPSLIDANPALARFSAYLGAESYFEFLAAFGLLAISALTVGNAFLAFEHWMTSRYLADLGVRMQTSVLDRILVRPYEYFVTERNARLSDVVLRQVERVTDGVVGQSIVVVSNLALAAFVVAMLLTVSFRITLTTLFLLIGLFFIVFLLLRGRLHRHGEELTRRSGDLLGVANEVFNGIREIKLRRAETFFADRFERPARRIAELAKSFSLMNAMPHFLLETLIFAVLIGVALFVLLSTESPGMTLSLIALYGLATYRLVPALQSLFDGLSHIQHNADAVAVVRGHLSYSAAEPRPRGVAPTFGEIRLHRIVYRFPGAAEPVLDGGSLVLPVGSSLCLFGPSGSGKSTLLNILAGLTQPHSGRLLCNNVEIGEAEIASWQRLIGFCPQQIFLFDGSVAANIAFGVPESDIDFGRIEAVMRLARIDEFATDIRNSVVAEHGKNLSGGQAQRIGIARAIYHDPSLLIFDEAFNGLDAGNRDAILDSLLADSEKTVVFASHDPRVAARCNMIVTLRKGRFQILDSVAMFDFNGAETVARDDRT